MDFWFILLIIPAALADSISPCAFAILFVILSSIISQTWSRSKALQAGFAFSAAIFISYYLMGVGAYKAFSFTGQFFYLQLGAAILSILIGLWNLKDYFWYKKFFSMEMPDSLKLLSKRWIKKVTSPAWAFFVGILISLFLLPCTGWPYLTILSYLSSESQSITRLMGYIYLLLYNLIFIAPFLAITCLVYFGIKDVGELKEYREYYTREIHLVIWLLMLWLGIYLLADTLWF